MSYDLRLTPRCTFSLADFRRYFEHRPCYRLDDGSRRAYYEREATGTYFSFAFDQPLPEAHAPAGLLSIGSLAGTAAAAGDRSMPSQGTPASVAAAPQPDGEAVTEEGGVAFELSYFRPTTFALEAGPELSAFVAAFACGVDDPQIEGMRGSYSEGGFLRAWNVGNVAAMRALLEHRQGGRTSLDAALDEMRCATAPHDVVVAAWEWGRGRDERLVRLGGDPFAARLVWGRERRRGTVEPTATWTHGVRTLLPETATRVLLVRPRRPGLLSRLVRRAPPGGVEGVVVVAAALREALGTEPIVDAGVACHVTPAAWDDLGGRMRPVLAGRSWTSRLDEALEVVRPDNVLDLELLEAAWDGD